MFFTKVDLDYLIKVRITPNSTKAGITGIYTDSNDFQFIKVSINSVPEKGKANAELIKLLSKLLKINKSSFKIISGETDKFKKILISAPDTSNIGILLNEIAESL